MPKVAVACKHDRGAVDMARRRANDGARAGFHAVDFAEFVDADTRLRHGRRKADCVVQRGHVARVAVDLAADVFG